MKLRQKLAKWLISTGIRLYGEVAVEETVKEVKREQHPPKSAVVDAVQEDLQWTPEQTGGVIIEEPLIMTKFRRGDDL